MKPPGPGEASRNGQRTQAQCRSSSIWSSGVFQGRARKRSRSTVGLTPAWTNRTASERQFARKPSSQARIRSGSATRDHGQKLFRVDRPDLEIQELPHHRAAAVAQPVGERRERGVPRRAGSRASRIIVSWLPMSPIASLAPTRAPAASARSTVPRLSGPRSIRSPRKTSAALLPPPRLARGLVDQRVEKIGAAVNVADGEHFRVRRDGPRQGKSLALDDGRHDVPYPGRARHCKSDAPRASIGSMFLTFFANLRQAHVPVTPREYLDLMRALEGDLADRSVDEFYRLSRALLVKDERNLDKFDVVFASTFKGVLSLAAAVEAQELPEEWLRAWPRNTLPRGAGRNREARLRQADGDAAPAPRRAEGAPPGRLEVDRHRRNVAVRRLRRPSRGRAHRPGQGPPRQRDQGLGQARVQGLRRRRRTGPRNIKLALRRLRRFAREGAAEELDLDGTIRSTADHGYIDVKLGPSGATPSRCCCSSTSAARWTGTSRRPSSCSPQREPVQAARALLFPQLPVRERVEEQPPPLRGADRHRDLLNAYGRDYRVVFVGDASMSPYEIVSPGGSVEHLNPEPGRSGSNALSRPGRARCGSTRPPSRTGPIRNRPRSSPTFCGGGCLR